jgi:hypothetical protein
MRDRSRRTMLAGACGSCAAVVAGCATYATGRAAPTEIAPVPPVGDLPRPGVTADDAPGAGVLAATADIPVGGGRVFAAADVVVTQPRAGTFVAFSATCTHQGGLHGQHHHRRHGELPVSRQQLRAGRRVGGAGPGAQTVAREGDPGQRRADQPRVTSSTV